MMERISAMKKLFSLELLKTAQGSTFIYSRNSHRVLAANPATYANWGMVARDFLDSSEGLYRLWVNPIDWSLQEQLVIDHGACVGLKTRMHHRNGNLIDVQVTSLGLASEDTDYVLTYILKASYPSPIHTSDEQAFVELLGVPEAVQARSLLSGEAKAPSNNFYARQNIDKLVPLLKRQLYPEQQINRPDFRKVKRAYKLLSA